MSLEGDLSAIGLSDIFQTLAASQKAGTLIVENPESRRSIYFQEGMVWVISEGVRKNIKLGEALIAQGKITPAQLATALEQQEVTRERLGEILESMGIVTQTDVELVIRSQLEEDIFDVFTWKSGKFRFLEDTIPEGFDETDDVMSLNVSSIVMEAARRSDELEIIREWVPNDDYVFRVREGAECGQYDESFKELILGLLDGEQTVNDLAEGIGGHRFELKTALAELVSEGVLEPIPAEAMVELGIGAMEEGDAERAARLLQVAVEREPEEVPNYLLLAEAYESIGDKRRAGQTYKLGAVAAAEAGEVEHATDFLARARRLLPNDLEVNEQLLDLLAEFQDTIPDAELKFLEEGKALVKAYRRDKRYPAAIKLCRRLLQEDPEDLEIHKSLVNIYLDQGDDEEAINEYEIIAQLARKRKDHDELTAVLQKIAKLDPGRTGEINKQLDMLAVSSAERRRRSVRRVLRGVVVLALLAAALGGGYLWHDARQLWDGFEARVRLEYIKARDWEGARDEIDLFKKEHPRLVRIFLADRVHRLTTEINQSQDLELSGQNMANEEIRKTVEPALDEARKAWNDLKLRVAQEHYQTALNDLRKILAPYPDLQEDRDPDVKGLEIDLRVIASILNRGEAELMRFRQQTVEARQAAEAGHIEQAQEILEAARQHLVSFLAEGVVVSMEEGLRDLIKDHFPKLQGQTYADIQDFREISFPILLATSASPVEVEWQTLDSVAKAVPGKSGKDATPVVMSVPAGDELLQIKFQDDPIRRFLPRDCKVKIRVDNRPQEVDIWVLLLGESSRSPVWFNLEVDKGGSITVANDRLETSDWGPKDATLATFDSPVIVFQEYRLPVITRLEETCTSPPVVVDGHIVVAGNGMIYRIEPGTGKVVQKTDLTTREEFRLPSIRVPILVPPSGPVFAVENRGDVVELDRQTLEVRRIHATPACAAGGAHKVHSATLVGQEIVFTTGTPTVHEVMAFNITTHTYTSWDVARRAGEQRYITGGPVVLNGRCFVPSDMAIFSVPFGAAGFDASGRLETPWSPSVGIVRGDLKADENGIIYGVSSEGPTFFALDPGNATRSTHKLGAALKDSTGRPVEVERMSSPAVSPEVIVVGSLDGRLFGFKPWRSGENLQQAWPPVRVSEEPVLADPVLHEGTVYIGTSGGDVFAVEAATGIVQWRAVLYRDPARERRDERMSVELPIGVCGSGVFVAPRGTSSLYVLPR